MRGKLITIEGGEHTGKTTLRRALESAYPEFDFTQEPYSRTIGDIARNASDPMSQLFLFQSDRARHCHSMKVALDAGVTIICDRFTDSTLAYQGYGHGIDLDTIRQLNQIASRDLVPDLTILLDLDPLIAQSRGTASDPIEEMALEFHQSVRAGYLALAAAEPNRFVVIDAAMPMNEVLGQARKAINGVIGQ